MPARLTADQQTDKYCIFWLIVGLCRLCLPLCLGRTRSTGKKLCATSDSVWQVIMKWDCLLRKGTILYKLPLHFQTLQFFSTTIPAPFVLCWLQLLVRTLWSYEGVLYLELSSREDFSWGVVWTRVQVGKGGYVQARQVMFSDLWRSCGWCLDGWRGGRKGPALALQRLRNTARADLYLLHEY